MDDTYDEENVTYEWSDDKCFEIANKHYFPSSIKNRDIQKGIIIDFFNFYLGGKCRTGLNVTDLVFAVLSILPVTPKIDSEIWPCVEYKTDGSLLDISPTGKPNDPAGSCRHQPIIEVSAQDKTNADTEKPRREIYISSSNREIDKQVDVDVTDIISSDEFHSDGEDEQEELNCTPMSIKSFNDNLYGGGVTFAKVLEYTPVDNSAFINSVTTLLERWSEPDGTARAMLKYFFAVIALILMRSTTKGYKHLEYAFTNDKFLSLIKFSVNDIKYSVPHKRCLKAAYRKFMKRDKKTPVMFAKIIKLYLSLADKHKLKITIKNALLSHTSNYGLGLVSLWQRLSKTVVDIKTLTRLSRTKKTKQSWYRLTEFSKKYSEQKTFFWARVINSQYFAELSCSKNYELAVIMAVFVEELTHDSNIWKATWVHSGDLENAKKVAHAIHERYLHENI